MKREDETQTAYAIRTIQKEAAQKERERIISFLRRDPMATAMIAAAEIIENSYTP